MTGRPRYLDRQGEIDLRKVRYFLAVAHHLNFGRAAAALLIAQPALSRAVKALEADLGVLLFHRDQHSVTLTDAGSALAGEADALLARVAAARRRVRTAGAPSTTLTIGVRPGIIITDVVQRFARKHPEVTVVVQRIEWDEQDAAVLDGRVDLAWVRMPGSRARRFRASGLEIVPLFDDPETIALPIGHRLAAQESVRLSDLDGESVIRFDVAPSHDVGRASEISGIHTVEDELDAVALGHGLALVPASAAAYYQRSDVAYRPLADAQPYEVALATTAGQRARPEVESFIDVAVLAHKRGPGRPATAS